MYIRNIDQARSRNLPFSIQFIGVAMNFDVTGNHTDFLNHDWRRETDHIHMEMALFKRGKVIGGHYFVVAS